MLKNFTLCLLLTAGFLTMAIGQIQTPAASPSSTLMQKVGLTDITVEYSRPSTRGRAIFGADGIVPFDQIWRTGANQISKITFSEDVTVEGKALKAGSYGILTKPSASNWAVHFYAYETGNWSSYVDKEPAAAVSVASQKLPFSIETFLINIDQITAEGAVLGIVWSDTFVPVKIAVATDAAVMASIDRTMAGPSVGDYYAAGAYMHDSGKDLNKALMYVRKATSGDSPRFWQVRKESLILADLGKTAEAIAAAKKSLALAKEAGNDDYVRMNEKSIKQWSM